MSTIIPLTSPGAAPAAGANGGVLIPLRFGSNGAAPRATLETQALRAVAAAVALTGAADSMAVSQSSRVDPAATIQKISPDGEALRPVLKAIRAAQQNRANAPAPTEEQRRVAEAVGADPVLVAAAQIALQQEGAQLQARALVAASDPNLLDRAARAAAVRQQFLKAEAETSTPSGLEKVEAELTTLRQKLAVMEARLDGLPGVSAQAPVQSPAARAEAPQYQGAKGGKIQVPAPDPAPIAAKQTAPSLQVPTK